MPGLTFRRSALLFALLAALSAPQEAGAQIKTITTDHFRIHFRGGSEGTARRVAETAEEVFAPLAAAYDYYDDFSPIHVIVVDNSDVLGNGSADYYSNLIIIWATSLDFELRGSHDWIKNVLTHELTHVMTLNKARKKWPFQFALLQVSRFDANPDISFNFPLFHLNAPRWWAEGISQYATQQFGFESWDSHRDMLLRMAVLEDDLLTYEEMGSIGSRGGKNYGELVYNQGYAMLLYIHAQYGRDKVEALTHHVGTVNFDPAIRRVLGISADQLYADWLRFLEEHYGQMATEIRGGGYFEGEPLSTLNEGILEYFPAYSPDGTKLAYITSEKRDYSIPYLKVHDFETGRTKVVREKKLFRSYATDMVGTRMAWSPDSRQVVFARNKNGLNDLYIYDLETDELRRISAQLRARDPSFSPDGERIAFVHNEDGTQNLGLIQRDGTGLAYLTNHSDGTQYSAPRFSPDGKWILFSIFHGEDRDIAMIRADSPSRPKDYGFRDRRQVPDSLQVFPDSLAIPHPDTSGFRALLASPADERDPWWLPDGSGFVFSSDRTGIFNLYRYHLESGRVEQLTNVLGGAFAPTVSPSGRVAYSGYHANDYDLYAFEVGEYQEEALFEPFGPRDYHASVRPPKLSEEYSVGPYAGRKLLHYVPVLSVGPTFLGDEFGLNQISAGLQFSTGEQFGGQELTAWGIFGKNFRARTDLNTDLGIFYERRLRPMAGNNRSFNPSFYVSLRRREIDSVAKNRYAHVDSFASDTYWVQPVVDRPDSSVLVPDVKAYGYEVQSREDHFKDVFQTLAVGIDMPLTRGQRLSLQYLRRHYSEKWDLKEARSRFRWFFVQGDSADVTALFPPEQVQGDTTFYNRESPLAYYDDLDFFSSHDLSLSWIYSKVNPTADNRINPTGRSVALLYRYMLPTVADSLAEQTSPDGVPRDQYGGATRRLRLNEYIGLYQERIGLPFDNALSLAIMGGYRNQRVKNYTGDGGFFEGAFYWPLRYYIGGLNFLSGYPYFVRRGSKLLYGRVGYSFPLVPRARTRFFNFHVSKIYARLFAETGSVANFDEFPVDPDLTGKAPFLKLNGFSTKSFLSDVGGEVRMELFSFYQIPMTAFFQVAHPLSRQRELEPRLQEWREDVAATEPGDEPPPRPEKIDKWRFYFGLGLF